VTGKVDHLPPNLDRPTLRRSYRTSWAALVTS
jgi:hypothetical protein